MKRSCPSLDLTFTPACSVVASLADRIELLRAYSALHPVGAGLLVRVASAEDWWHEEESETLPDALAALCRAPDDSRPAGILYGARVETPRARAISLRHAERVLACVEADILALDRSLAFRAVAAAELQSILESLREALAARSAVPGAERGGR